MTIAAEPLKNNVIPDGVISHRIDEVNSSKFFFAYLKDSMILAILETKVEMGEQGDAFMQSINYYYRYLRESDIMTKLSEVCHVPCLLIQLVGPYIGVAGNYYFLSNDINRSCICWRSREN